MIDGLIFDKDGTLFDFRRSWGTWVTRLLDGLATDDAHRRALADALGFDLETADFAPHSPVIAQTAPEIALVLAPHLPGMDHAALVDLMNTIATGAPMAEAVPLRPLFAAFKARGLKIGLATNDTEAPARVHLSNHGIDGYFDFISGYDSGYGGKPAPGQLIAFVRQHGLTPERVAMVGDSRHDLEAGRAAGMVCVAVLTGIASASDLAPYADVVLADIGRLEAWMDGLSAA